MSYYPEQQQPRRRRRQSFSGLKIRLIMAAGIMLFSVVSYYSSGTVNPVTGEKQLVGGLTPAQEVEIGRSAAYQMIQQHGGITSDSRAGSQMAQLGKRIENALYQRLQRDGIPMPYTFDFHLLADRRAINAFALPGGQIFITEALYNRLTHPGQLVGVLGHEIGHVIERHGVERMAQGGFFQRIAGAAGVAGGGRSSAGLANAALNSIGMSYGRQAELESDRWGVELMVLMDFHPEHMLEVMEILKEASGAGSTPEFMSSHPKPENRQKYIREVIAERFPDGLPPGLN